MEGASVGYDGRAVLQKLNLTISNDDRIGLLGASWIAVPAIVEPARHQLGLIANDADWATNKTGVLCGANKVH